MRHKCVRLSELVGLLLFIGVVLMLAAEDIHHDKYTLKVPGGLAFSEFRGYESWQAVAMSRNQGVVAMTLGNPVMMDAYRAGFPGNGKPAQTGPRWPKFSGLRKTTSFSLTRPYQERS